MSLADKVPGARQPTLRPDTTTAWSGESLMTQPDLIDHNDFRLRLVALGIDVPSGVDAMQACRLATSGISPDRARALRRLAEELLAGSAALRPCVREAICLGLLPALVPR